VPSQAGLEAIIPNAADAVRCAIEAQNGMVERNAGLPPECRIEFRVGIHLDNVVEESDGARTVAVGRVFYCYQDFSDGYSMPLTASKSDHGQSRLSIARPTEQWT
jgi:hypothetical protein